MPDKRRVLLDKCVFQAPDSDCFYYLGSWSLTCPLFVIQNRKAPTEFIKPASDWVTKIPAHGVGVKLKHYSLDHGVENRETSLSPHGLTNPTGNNNLCKSN